MSLALAGQLTQIDWEQPWFAPYAAQGRLLAEAVLAALPTGSSATGGALHAVARALNQRFDAFRIVLPAGRLRAVGQSLAQCPLNLKRADRPLQAGKSGPVAARSVAAEAYESHIARTACLPVRDDLHDFFNGLVWLHQPRLKARLNALQAAEIAQRGVGDVRGPLRDALTRFDESGGLWHGPADLLDAWRERRWADLLWHSRARWPAEVRFEVFGHALLAQLATAARPGLTAHVLASSCAEAPEDMASEAWAAAPLLPLPVAGVPGWWPGQGIGLYADAAVFRPLPTRAVRG